MERTGTFSVIKADGGTLGPADRDTIRRWAEEGSIGINDQLMLADGRRHLVLQDDDLRVLVEAAQSSAMKHPGLRDIVVGALAFGLAAVLTISAVLVPQAMNMVPGHGTYAMSQVIWWIFMGVFSIGGGMLLLRGLRERKRAHLVETRIF